MKKYMLLLLLLSSSLSAKISLIDAITAAEAGQANPDVAGIAEAFQSIESSSKPYNTAVEATVADESVQPGFWARTRDRFRNADNAIRNQARRAGAAIGRGVERARSAIGQVLKSAGSAVKGSTATVNNIDTLN